MSISLCIEWSDGREEDVLVVGQHTAAVVWADACRRLGLKHYDGAFPMYVDPSCIEQVIAEFRALHKAVGPANVGDVDRLARLIERLEQLKSTTGWKAHIG